jgi:membrane protein
MTDIELRDGVPEPADPPARGYAFRRFRPVWTVLRDATDGVFRHDGVMVASAISYSLIFAIFPFAIFLVATGAVVGGADLSAYIRGEALAVLPADIVKTLEPELNRIFAVANRASPITFGLLVTLVSITGAVEAIRDGLNRAYGCTEDRHLVRRYLSSLFFVLVGVAFLILVAALGVAVPIGLEILDRFLPGEFNVGAIETMREALLVIVALAMLLALHLLLPVKRRRFGGVVGGVLFTLVGWWLSGKIFGLYIGKIANYGATYAGLAGFVILMFFLYIQALIFLFGAELNRSIADLRGEAVNPLP